GGAAGGARFADLRPAGIAAPRAAPDGTQTLRVRHRRRAAGEVGADVAGAAPARTGARDAPLAPAAGLRARARPRALLPGSRGLPGHRARAAARGRRLLRRAHRSPAAR